MFPLTRARTLRVPGRRGGGLPGWGIGACELDEDGRGPGCSSRLLPYSDREAFTPRPGRCALRCAATCAIAPSPHAASTCLPSGRAGGLGHRPRDGGASRRRGTRWGACRGSTMAALPAAPLTPRRQRCDQSRPRTRSSPASHPGTTTGPPLPTAGVDTDDNGDDRRRRRPGCHTQRPRSRAQGSSASAPRRP